MGTVPYGLISQAVVLSGGSWSDMLNLSSLNTLLILGTAFAVIVLIVILTFVIRIMPYHKEMSQTQNNTTVDHVNTQIAHQNDNLMSDSELVAVITAAIYASLGDAVPADGLIVRSIKKVGRKKRSNL